MKQSVSKMRTRKIRSREKRVGRTAAGARSMEHNALIGLLIGVLLWAGTLLLIGMPEAVSGMTDPKVMLPLAGDAAFLLIGLFATVLFLRMIVPETLERNTTVLMLALTALVSITLAKGVVLAMDSLGIAAPETIGFLLPLGMAPLLATILVNGAAGIGVGFWTSLALALLGGRSFPLLIAGLVATLIAAQTAHRVRTRTKVVRIGLVVGLSETVSVFALTALNWQTSSVMLVLHQGAACLVGGFFSALVVLLLLPIFELAFNVTSDITLLELSDLSHPLLQRLAIQAPGTYHHSLIVASLAQAAAEEIGANDLLARVQSYFHDVGKLTKPDFFVENLRLRSNPHDDLPPSMSTLVITSHVKEGLSLAMLHKLPGVVMRAIAEHHGTGLMSYFHHKAKTQVTEGAGAGNGASCEGPNQVDEGTYRYPGPKPSSRETAIVGLADAVEAASRSMERTTPGHIEGLVDDITNTRLLDGQFSDCELTFAELTRIQRAFTFTLTNMLHGRVPYPTKDEDRNQRPVPDAARNGQAGGKEPDPSPPGTAAAH